MTDLTLTEILAMQAKLQETYRNKWEPVCPETGKNKLLWMTGEIGEVIDIIKKHDVRQLVGDPNVRKDLVEEMADVLMYFGDVMLCYGITAEEFRDVYVAKFERNMTRW